MLEFAMNYWRELTFGGVTVAVLFGNKLKTWVGSVKLPALSGLFASKSKDTQNKKDVEAKDIECIAHLRDRAVESKDDVLLQEIKSVANKFFDMHSLVNEKE